MKHAVDHEHGSDVRPQLLEPAYRVRVQAKELAGIQLSSVFTQTPGRRSTPPHEQEHLRPVRILALKIGIILLTRPPGILT